jgi:hypothetical protein
MARENYAKGGDVVVECWEKYQFEDYVKLFGSVTRARALQMLRRWRSEEKERETMMFGEIW